MLKSPYVDDNERILVCGQTGTGKTNAFLEIARKSQQTKSDAKFYFIDTDRGARRLLNTDFTDLKNVILQRVRGWKRLVDATNKFVDKIEENDWLCVDMADKPWDWAQDYYIMQVFGMSREQYLIMKRIEFNKIMDDYKERLKKCKTEKEKEKIKKPNFKAMDGWLDWPIINATYFSWIDPLIDPDINFHLFMTASVNAVDDDDEKDTRTVFGSFGQKPTGQKRLGHQMQSIFYFNHFIKRHEFTITTMKDRASKDGKFRRYFEGDILKNFTIQYLIARAKWKI